MLLYIINYYIYLGNVDPILDINFIWQIMF